MSNKNMGKSPIKKFLEIYSKMRNYLPKSKYLNEKQKALFFEILDQIKNDFLALNADLKVRATGEMKSKVKESLRILNKILDRNVDQSFRNFSYDWDLMVFNWNNQVGRRPDYLPIIEEIRGKTFSKRTSRSSILEDLDLIEQKLRSLARYRPPIFELSQHYLKVLREELRKLRED